MEIFLSKAKPSTQLNRRFEVSTSRHVSPPTSIDPTSKPIKTEPNRLLHLSEDHRRHRRMCNTVSQRAEVSVTLTMYYIYICIYYIYIYIYIYDIYIYICYDTYDIYIHINKYIFIYIIYVYIYI